MPKEVEENIRASLRAAHPDWDEKTLNDKTFATMNKQGLLNNKHKRHGRKGRKK